MSELDPSVQPGDILWEPDPAEAGASNLARYWKWAEAKTGRRFHDYAELWTWSVEEPGFFWASVAEFFEVRWHAPARSFLEPTGKPQGTWFPGATLNYAEHALRSVQGEEAPAILFLAEPGPDGKIGREEISRTELARRVAVVAAELRRLGVGKGDRVAGYFSNSPEAPLAF